MQGGDYPMLLAGFHVWLGISLDVLLRSLFTDARYNQAMPAEFSNCL